MKTAVVNFKTTPEVKKRAMAKAKRDGVPLSFLLNRRLYEIAGVKNATVDFGYENQLAKDAKDLAQLHFDDLPSEDEWVAIQPSIN